MKKKLRNIVEVLYHHDIGDYTSSGFKDSDMIITKEQLQVVVDRLQILADCKNWRLDENSKKIVWIGSIKDPTMIAINALSILIDTEEK